MRKENPEVLVWRVGERVYCSVHVRGRLAFSYGVPLESISCLRVRLSRAGYLALAASQLEQIEAEAARPTAIANQAPLDLAVVSMIALWFCFAAALAAWWITAVHK
jgi:hypothetical protein